MYRKIMKKLREFLGFEEMYYSDSKVIGYVLCVIISLVYLSTQIVIR